MTENLAHKAETRLTLESRLADLARVWPWVDELAAEYGIPADTRYAIDLCLEEALSNIIRHGYAGEPGHDIAICFTPRGENGLTFSIRDHAPPFAPGEPAESWEAPASIDQIEAGGQGIRLMRKFAGALAYEQLPDGNRLTISFPVARESRE
jgi:anti-sigma regulatory factor (Ser/Thr protein kinase)